MSVQLLACNPIMKLMLLVSFSAITTLVGCGTLQPNASSKTDHASASHAAVGYTDTPMLPGGKWHVHDPERPQPRVVTPGTFSTPTTPGQAPSDAIVLFDGRDLSKWRTADGKPAPWDVQHGVIVCKPHSGDIFTKEEFGDIQLHLEFATPTPPHGESQERGNSGVFLFGKYELQVLDSYQ